jgi:hypothetical protein
MTLKKMEKERQEAEKQKREAARKTDKDTFQAENQVS